MISPQSAFKIKMRKCTTFSMCWLQFIHVQTTCYLCVIVFWQFPIPNRVQISELQTFCTQRSHPWQQFIDLSHGPPTGAHLELRGLTVVFLFPEIETRLNILKVSCIHLQCKQVISILENKWTLYLFNQNISLCII